MVTIRDWDTWVERSKDCEKGTDTDYWNHRTIEWVAVPKEHRRCGLATEAILGIQNYIGPLSDCDGYGWYKLKADWPECGLKFFDAIGPKLLGDVAGPLTPEEQAEREAERAFQLSFQQKLKQAGIIPTDREDSEQERDADH